jgi:hypothetical protein
MNLFSHCSISRFFDQSLNAPYVVPSVFSCFFCFMLLLFHGSFCFVLFMLLVISYYSWFVLFRLIHHPFVSCPVSCSFCFMLLFVSSYSCSFLFRLIHAPFVSCSFFVSAYSCSIPSVVLSLSFLCLLSVSFSLSLFSASPIAQGRAKLSTALLPKGRAPGQIQEMSALLRANKRACHRTCPSILQIAFYIEFGFLYLHKC